MYVIDSYEKHSASALAMLVLSRYLAAGGMTIAGNLIYSEFAFLSLRNINLSPGSKDCKYSTVSSIEPYGRI